MGYPWPKAPLADGTGTTSTDMQRIIGSQYMSSGVLPNGGLTVEGTSGMAYKVNSGACFMWTSYASRLGMLVPVDATTVNTVAAPSTGSRIDTVYVDGDGAVRVVQGTAIPSGVAIARFTVPAGITATTAAQQSIDRNFAIATGGTLGRLAQWNNSSVGNVGGNETVRNVSRFFLPSDRLLRLDMTTTLKSTVASEPGVSELSVQFVHSSGPGSTRRMLCSHTKDWNSWGTTWSFVASEGDWTVTVRSRAYSGGTWTYSSDSSYVTQMNLWDAGILR
ncbi:hypothetical protein [Brachybacterium tyrofermentans]|uniref:hypothetical protein n=1 Tax=Brachybacterium tyrofermentans TaxID=47848 RepID=UPI0018676214|nr:hypothetical protein [Brachybacterium tyrofermentans]